jgi:sodium-dependent dicarboxylate transporter 2/3/5
MIIGMPMVAIMLPVACYILMRYYPPEIETIGDLDDIQRKRRQLGPLTGQERRVLVLMGVMLVFWILGTWIPAFDTTLIGLAGACAMFLPGIRRYMLCQ